MDREFKGVWIPKEIWLNEDLGWSEKLLLVEIDSLSKNGECFASNEYFAKFLGISVRQVQNLLSNLKDLGLITSEIFYKEGTKQVEKRIISPCHENNIVTSRKKLHEGNEENCTTPHEIRCMTPHEKNGGDINTSFINTSFINTITNTTNKDLNILCENEPKARKSKKPSIPKNQLEQEFEMLWNLYPNKKGKSKAYTSYESARKNGKVTFEEVEKGILLYKQYIEFKNLESNFIKNGSTYFNQHCWNDEYDFTKKVVSAKDYIRQKYYGGGTNESRRERKIIGNDSGLLSESF